MAILGREAELDQIRSARGVVLLAGDSGIGKSALLQQAQWQAIAAIAPDPVVVAYSPGALQRGLLEALASVVGAIAADETGIERAIRLIESAATKVVDARLKGLARGVGRHLLDIVRTRVSPAAADLISQAAQAVSESVDESLANRISSAGDDDVIDLVLQLADEVLTLAGGPSLILALDEAHRLDAGDRRRLKDLVGKLPEQVVVRGAFTVAHLDDRQAIEDLGAAGVRLVPVAPLGERAVREWVETAGLNPELSLAVLEATNGYPLYVSAAVDLLRANPMPGSLEGLQPSEALVNATRQAWDGLSVPARRAATQLAAYRDRVPPERACDLLGVDALTWSDLEAELDRAHIFVAAPELWFHERRRLVVWEDVLTSSQRAAAASTAWAELTGRTEAAWSPDLLMEVARLAEHEPGLVAGDDAAAAVLGLSQGELAVAASLLELIEPAGQPAIAAEHVLEHARSLYRLDVDLLAAARSLAATNLVVIAEDDNAAVLAAAWTTPLALRLVVGRTARSLGRVPLPRLASAIFDGVLRPHVGGFHAAHYGIGAPTEAELGKMAAQAQRTPRNGTVVISDRWPNALLWGDLGGVPVYAAIGFDDAAGRSRFLAEVRDLSVDFFGQPFCVRRAEAHPGYRQPAIRLGRALERAGSGINLHMMSAPTLPSPVSLEQALEHTLTARRVIRTNLTSQELRPYGLRAPTGFRWLTDTNGSIVIEISNDDAVRPEPLLATVRPFGRLASVELAQMLDLLPSQRVIHRRWSSGPTVTTDPVAEAVVQACSEARAFNSTQARRTVRLDLPELEEMCTAESREVDRIAAAFAEAFPAKLSMPRARTVYVLLSDDFVQPGWVPGAMSSSIVAHCEAVGNQSSVRLKLVPNASASAGGGWEDISWIEREFGEAPGAFMALSHSGALDTIARLLSHESTDVWIEARGGPALPGLEDPIELPPADR